MHFNCVLSLYKKFDFMFASIGWQDSFSYNRFIFTIFAYILFTIDYTTPHLHTHTHLHTQIYNHTRHVQFNLMQLERKQVSPPFKPRLDSDRDLANFPIEFTGEPVQLTPDDE